MKPDLEQAQIRVSFYMAHSNSINIMECKKCKTRFEGWTSEFIDHMENHRQEDMKQTTENVEK